MSKHKTVFHSVKEFESEFYPEKESQKEHLLPSDMNLLGKEMAKLTINRIKKQYSENKGINLQKS